MRGTFIRAHYQITLPASVRRKVPIRIGDPVDISIRHGSEIVIRPLKMVDASQTWFWTRSHQEAEREAEVQRRGGKMRVARSAKHLIHELRKT